MANTAASVLSIARGELGYSRWNDPETGTKYGRWYAQGRDPYYGANGVPYCAMFVSWVMDQAGAKCAGIPEAYCPYILNKATSAGAVLADKTKAQPGDVVLFDWDGGVVDHVGFVEINQGSYIQTIEGNTNNGAVARRTRAWSTVKAVVRPSYGTSTTPVVSASIEELAQKVINGDFGTGEQRKQALGDKYDAVQKRVNEILSGNTSSEATESSETVAIDVDGYWGPKTTLRLQNVLGAPYKDGVISRQTKIWKAKNPGLTDGWEWDGKNGDGGSQTIKLIQKKVGLTGYDVDGKIGPTTIKAIQRYYGTTVDGCFSGPSYCIKAMQRALNAGKF